MERKMDECFCPVCGAVLNDQCGFDPNGGTWTCTECGNLLMGDDVFYGDTYSGVAWYCDECNALMNIQFGFSDSYGTWTCTECGHVNGTTEQDIYESQEDYEYQKSVNEGSGFFGSIIKGVISALGEISSDDEDTSDDDYTSSYSTIVNSTDKSSTSIFSKSSLMQFNKKEERDLQKKRLKAFLFNKKNILIGYDCHALLGKDVKFVLAAIYNRAFNNIKVTPIKDIYINSTKLEGEVEQIIVNGISFFDSNDSFPYNVEIIITYHEKREITLPFDAKRLSRQNYTEVRDVLMELGFTKIYELPINDLITGWLTQNGSVEKVSIAGNDTFIKNSIYKYDAEIIIKYHTFKSRKQEKGFCNGIW